MVDGRCINEITVDPKHWDEPGTPPTVSGINDFGLKYHTKFTIPKGTHVYRWDTANYGMVEQFDTAKKFTFKTEGAVNGRSPVLPDTSSSWVLLFRIPDDPSLYGVSRAATTECRQKIQDQCTPVRGGSIHERVAKTLGLTVEQMRGLSLLSLRDFVLQVDPNLADEMLTYGMPRR